MTKLYKPMMDREINGGIQRIYKFDNDYGASVVCHKGSYGGEQGLWEVAVVTFEKDTDHPLDFQITYDTPITNDVIGWLSDNDMLELLSQIENL